MRQILFIMVLAAALLCRAQGSAPDKDDRFSQYVETGMEVSGVSFPYYDADGNLQAKFFGQHAKVIEGTKVEITNLKIEIYRDSKVAATIFAPQCFSNVDIRSGKARGNALTVQSDGPILMDSDEMTLTGRGFVWSSLGQKVHFEVLNESKVLIKKEAQQLMEVKP